MSDIPTTPDPENYLTGAEIAMLAIAIREWSRGCIAARGGRPMTIENIGECTMAAIAIIAHHEGEGDYALTKRVYREMLKYMQQRMKDFWHKDMLDKMAHAVKSYWDAVVAGEKDYFDFLKGGGKPS